MSIREVAALPLATGFGEFELRAFELSSGDVYLALVSGDLGDGRSVLTRLHSECLTGDALGSRRCDCGTQLREAGRAIAAEGRGVLVYATGHEGRGIGLVNKLRAYMLQDDGADTIDANLRLGFPADGRDYAGAAACLRRLGIQSVRLLTNNPSKVKALTRSGIDVEDVVPLRTSPHVRNADYLHAKEERLGHLAPAGVPLGERGVAEATDVAPLLGRPAAPSWRPYVVVKYAQTVDGRIATRRGDARWISSEAERRISHGLRAACDAVLVGVGTAIVDDPQLTVRMVPGSSPLRVVLDSTLRVPPRARILDGGAGTVVITTERSREEARAAVRARGVAVRVVEAGPRGVDLGSALATLRSLGVASLLVEGGARVITSFFAENLVDRLVVGIAPTIMGAGVDAVGDLGVARVAESVHLANRSVHQAGEDLVLAADVRVS
ncbi:MAG: GTP cyclohydrolase II [Actinomycetota bacterium]|nr:GTP cyclohydrolase II [Actinomycetota bacterium]